MTPMFSTHPYENITTEKGNIGRLKWGTLAPFSLDKDKQSQWRMTIAGLLLKSSHVHCNQSLRNRRRDTIFASHTASSPAPSHHILFFSFPPPPPKTDLPDIPIDSMAVPWSKLQTHPSSFPHTLFVLMISAVLVEPPDWFILRLNYGSDKPRWRACRSLMNVITKPHRHQARRK
ncbi:hypothetical protein ASPSYDRAFT_639916 [Aspergillus sydowii CBS 593.65]|uniref:Uncharacterized protein n=1 Tax=Aspergillus sydowii CBS 593.65 TaxID=1036612 RepID=A0A1L9TSM9_9EURO|nr:uncharacterized protein ASPSYDRAFT_639916 [Aspergillus sydowii CBS 593.65]OJJ62378.1 hypothetical protein ASPSYDRAFT_639916 [Aspergillus sydowii CBS 593.65]